MPQISINDRPVSFEPGDTILQAAKRGGYHIPTLCHMENCAPLGACRVCIVELRGAAVLPAACSTPAVEGMQVYTHTSRVRKARRTVVQLMLSEHQGDCTLCERAQECELRDIAASLDLRMQSYQGCKPPMTIDASTPALVRETGKCIGCRRCVRMCNNVQGIGALFPQGRGFETVIGPAFNQPLSEVVCVQCGQCAAVCPVGAIYEKDHMEGVWQALENPDKRVVVQVAPAIRAAIGEPFGFPPGTRVTGKLATALRKLGFSDVFDTNFTADLTILEEGTELLTRLTKVLRDKEPAALPMFTSCSPGWIRFTEQVYPSILDHISTCKSPQQMFGALAKTYYADKLSIPSSDMTVVSVMPCTAKKFEAGRAEMGRNGLADVDYVLTTRELAKMITAGGIDFASLEDEPMDAPLGISSGAADIFANTGGVMEAALRTVYELITGRELPGTDLHVQPLAGLQGIKEAQVKLENLLPDYSFLEGVTLRVAVAHGLQNARVLAKQVADGTSPYHFIEVMTCPGGCIGGGGQPRFTTDEIRQARIAAIYAEDEGKEIRKSHLNPEVEKLYNEYLGTPLGQLSHELLHTSYGGNHENPGHS